MESAVERLEAMFVKAEADLDYIEKRLRLDFISRPAEGEVAEENPAVMLENLRTVRAKHSALSSQLKEISAAHSQSVSSIQSSLSSMTHILQSLQEGHELQVEQLTESEKESAKILASFLIDNQSQVRPAAPEQQPQH